MPSAPTSRQLEIAEFLEAEIQRRGIMPTQREIATRFGFASPNSVRSHLRLMAKKGMVAWLPGKARGLKLTFKVSSGIPMRGRIGAGAPREAIQEAEETIYYKLSVEKHLTAAVVRELAARVVQFALCHKRVVSLLEF